jgi:hypothetical protein
MGLPRSTYYDAGSREADDAEIVATMTAICDEFEAYGYRRVGAEMRHRTPTSRSPPALSTWPPSSTPGRAGWSDMRSAARSMPVWLLQP